MNIRDAYIHIWGTLVYIYGAPIHMQGVPIHIQGAPIHIQGIQMQIRGLGSSILFTTEYTVYHQKMLILKLRLSASTGHNSFNFKARNKSKDSFDIYTERAF